MGPRGKRGQQSGFIGIKVGIQVTATWLLGWREKTRVWQTANCSPKCIVLFLHNEGVLARHKVTHQETAHLRLLTVGKGPTSCQENVNRSDEFSFCVTFLKGNCLPFVFSLCLSPWPGQPNFSHACKDCTLRRGNKMEQTLYGADFPINLDHSPLNCYVRKKQYSVLLVGLWMSQLYNSLNCSLGNTMSK